MPTVLRKNNIPTVLITDFMFRNSSLFESIRNISVAKTGKRAGVNGKPGELPNPTLSEPMQVGRSAK
jgi:hypothetical protein